MLSLHTFLDNTGEYVPSKKAIQRKSYGITAQSKPLCGLIPLLLWVNLHAIVKRSVCYVVVVVVHREAFDRMLWAL